LLSLWFCPPARRLELALPNSTHSSALAQGQCSACFALRLTVDVVDGPVFETVLAVEVEYLFSDCVCFQTVTLFLFI